LLFYCTGAFRDNSLPHNPAIRQATGSATTQDSRKSLKTIGGSVCESNTPATSKMPPAGFEDRDDHRTACASIVPGNVRANVC